MTATATIRVPRETRDLLFAQASDRGISVSALVTEFAVRTQRVDAFRSEREATRTDADDDRVTTEEREGRRLPATVSTGISPHMPASRSGERPCRGARRH
jgi:hypothetical protein